MQSLSPGASLLVDAWDLDTSFLGADANTSTQCKAEGAADVHRHWLRQPFGNGGTVLGIGVTECSIT